MASKSITRTTHNVVKVDDNRWLVVATAIEVYPTLAVAEHRRRTLARQNRITTACVKCGCLNFGVRDRCKAPAACARRARQQQTRTQ